MKRTLFITIFCLFPMLLSACGAASGNGTGTAEPPPVINWSEISGAANSTSEAAETPQATVEEAVPPAPESETQPPAAEAVEASPDPYRTIYTQAVTENTDPVSFSLIYLDNDDIPELIVYDGYYGAYSIYTVKDNALFCIADAFSTVEMTYFERSGIIVAFARWNGGGDEGGYGRYYYQVSTDNTITDDTMPVLSYDYNAIYDEAGNYTGEGITRYYHMGEELEEAAYQEILAGFGITDEYGDIVPESFLGKEEMLAVLRKH